VGCGMRVGGGEGEKGEKGESGEQECLHGEGLGIGF
jgi:hypothetical protein